MSRLPEIIYENLSDKQKEAYDYLMAADGEITGEFAIWLQLPELCLCIKKTNEYMQKECGFKPEMLPVLGLIAARKMNCAYMFGLYAERAIKAGVPMAVIDAINKNEHVKYDDPVDQILFDMAVILSERKMLPDDVFARCRELLGRDPTTAASVLVGQYLMGAMLVNAFDYPVKEGYVALA